MAIRDLLWACPICGVPNALVPAGRRADACVACGARLRRGGGSSIVVEVPGKPPVIRPAAEWCDVLPALNGGDPPLDGHVRLREADPDERPVFAGGELLGFIEHFGKAIPGIVTLDSDAVRFEAEDGGHERRWRFDELTAVQPASSALQLKARGRPVASLRFTSCSVRLWERRIQNAIRQLYRDTGRGEVVEFQPRISAR